MDDKMLKAGGEAMRKQLVSQFDDLSLAYRAKWTKQDEEVAKHGDYMQAERLNEQKAAR